MDDKLENFERAFTGNSGGCVRTCRCGVTYFDNHNNHYDWDEGEFERLLANPANVALDYAPGDIRFEGNEYVDACSCWHARASQIMGFIDGHSHAIADYLSLEKKRFQAIADNAATVRQNT